MKRIIITVCVILASILPTLAQQLNVRGNFTGKGVETLTFNALGYSNPPEMADEAADVFRVTSDKKFSPSFVFRGYYPGYLQAYDVDGDGCDELAFGIFGMNGCWGAILVYDYFNGQWHTLSNDASLYDCNDDVPARLIYPSSKKGYFKIMSWQFDDLQKGLKSYPIRRKLHTCPLNQYYLPNGKVQYITK